MEPHAPPGTALYIHVPFCQARCAYCDFNTYAGLEDLIPAYVAAVCQEIESAGERWGWLAVPTVFFGGGTPSLLPLDLLAKLFQILRFTFHVPPRAEITLEANPGTVTPAYLRGLRALGVSRLSLGVQSAHDDELRLLGRIHTWAQAVEAVEWAREAGFANLNLDLIFGLPRQTPARWKETLEAALGMGPAHLSLYGLSVEERTPLAEQIASGALPAPDEDLAADMYEMAEEILAEAGFFHYEISNWARLDTGCSMLDEMGWRTENMTPWACRHNLTYWRNEPWLGVGAGAHSWLGGRRWANVRHPREYGTFWLRRKALGSSCGTAAPEEGTTPVDEMEEIGQRLETGETMMMRLRLAEGMSDAGFRARFGLGLETAFGEELAQLRDMGLLEWDGSAARLTARGRLLGNQVFARFV